MDISKQGKGLMTTYWLVGIDTTGTDDATERKDTETSGGDDALEEDGNINGPSQKFCNNPEGKISIADSGIGIDRMLDERFGNVYLGTNNVNQCDLSDKHSSADKGLARMGSNESSNSGDDVIGDNDTMAWKLRSTSSNIKQSSDEGKIKSETVNKKKNNKLTKKRKKSKISGRVDPNRPEPADTYVTSQPEPSRDTELTPPFSLFTKKFGSDKLDWLCDDH